MAYRGNKIARAQEDLLNKIVAKEKVLIEQLASISYHGGLLEMPKIQKLRIALTEEYLILLTFSGEYVKSFFNTWKGIEKFTIVKRHDHRDRSMVLFGPFNDLIFKDKFRHFITIKYKDNRGIENNILIEHSNEEVRNDIYDKINTVYKNHESW